MNPGQEQGSAMNDTTDTTETPRSAPAPSPGATSPDPAPAADAAVTADPGAAPSSTAPTAAPGGDLQGRVVDVLKTCFDPEIPVNIYELGLIYSIQVDPPGAVSVRMTLTSPMCPVAGSLPPEVEAKIRGVAGVTDAKVDVVWEPPWSPAMMSDAAKLQLNLF